MFYQLENGNNKLSYINLSDLLKVTRLFGSAFWRAANEEFVRFTPEGVNLFGQPCPSTTQCENWDDILFSAYIAGIKAVYTARKKDSLAGMPMLANNSQQFQDSVLTFSTMSGDWKITAACGNDNGFSIEGPQESSIWNKLQIENDVVSGVKITVL